MLTHLHLLVPMQLYSNIYAYTVVHWLTLMRKPLLCLKALRPNRFIKIFILDGVYNIFDLKHPMEANTFLGFFYVISPFFGFLPQIWRRDITYSPLLSLLSVISSVIKVFHYQIESFDLFQLYQFLLLVVLHLYLINNYKRPLGRTELRVFSAELYLKHGLMTCAVSIIAMAVATIYVFILMGSGFLLGYIASVLDIGITLLQLAIYKNNVHKPRELFAAWIVGDFIKLGIMIMAFEMPYIYIAATVLQIVINSYVLCN